jgi:hypothetical protein
MAALTPEAYCLDEEKLMELRELLQDGAAGVDVGLEEGLSALRCQAAALQHAERLSSESWDWAEKIEDLARRAAETMREEGDDIRQAVSVLSLRRPGPGEYDDAAFVEALRKQATLSDARRADAEELRAATRRLQEKELRRVAAADHHLVDPDMPAFLGYVASHTDSALEAGYVPTAEELAEAAQVEDDALRMEERMARMAVRLRRGAAEFAARRPGDGEEALVTALHRQAANADAARATVQAFTASVRRFRAAGSTLRPRPTTGPGPGPGTEDDAHENLSSVYLIVVVLIAT